MFLYSFYHSTLKIQAAAIICYQLTLLLEWFLEKPTTAITATYIDKPIQICVLPKRTRLIYVCTEQAFSAPRTREPICSYLVKI